MPFCLNRTALLVVVRDACPGNPNPRTDQGTQPSSCVTDRDEDGIVWTEGITPLDYVRETLVGSAGTRRRPVRYDGPSRRVNPLRLSQLITNQALPRKIGT